MKKLFRLAALAAVTLPLLVACKPNEGNQPTNNELDGPYVDFAEIVNGKLVLDNEKFTKN